MGERRKVSLVSFNIISCMLGMLLYIIIYFLRRVPYSALCEAFERIEVTTKRLEILEITTNFFRAVIELSPESLLESLYLCLNKV